MGGGERKRRKTEGHLQGRPVGFFHVEVGPLNADVVGKVEPLWQVLFQVRPHGLVWSPALQMRTVGGTGGGGGG